MLRALGSGTGRKHLWRAEPASLWTAPQMPLLPGEVRDGTQRAFWRPTSSCRVAPFADDFPAEDQRHLVRAADVEVAGDDLVEEDPS
jgi:hypothetical protein